MTNIHVIDSIMGTGKTSAAINKMNEDVENNYVFITPFLNEVSRIKEHCNKRKFFEPLNRGQGKLHSLHQLLANQYNIASTHALFKNYNEYTIELLKQGNYILILDEVCDVVEQVSITPFDLSTLLEHWVYVKDNMLLWREDRLDYEGKFDNIKEMCLSKSLVLYGDCLLMWNFPVSVFEGFKEIYILTYLFRAQLQKYYYDYYGVKYDYWGVEHSETGYEFTPNSIEYKNPTLKTLVNILEDPKMNKIGDDKHALSVTWYKREKENKYAIVKQLKANMTNFFINRRKPSKVEYAMWTVFKDYQMALKGKGYATGHVSVNARATNEYRNKINLAYAVNIFFNPIYKQFFEQKDIKMYEEDYALSEMVQWIWRSAIRDGNPIWIYIPSRRMRELLKDWLDSLC